MDEAKMKVQAQPHLANDSKDALAGDGDRYLVLSIGIAVRMIFHRQPLVGLLDLFKRCIGTHAQHIVQPRLYWHRVLLRLIANRV